MKRGGDVRPTPGARAGIGRVVPAIVFHGDRDTTVNPRNADAVVAQTANVSGHARPLTVDMRKGQVPGGHTYSRALYLDAAGKAVIEQWTVHGAGHAWSGGSPDGSYTDPFGPDASEEMLRFFLAHPREDRSPPH
jgi:poly(3-hydroxybutyrate) depolymerase